MPASAFALLGVFILLAVGVGIGAAWVIGPRARVAVILPVLAAFGGLYVVGHRTGLELGPTILLFGYQVAIVQDVLVAVVAAGVVALIQRAVLTRRAARAAGPSTSQPGG